jgi:hypothetical protein
MYVVYCSGVGQASVSPPCMTLGPRQLCQRSGPANHCSLLAVQDHCIPQVISAYDSELLTSSLSVATHQVTVINGNWGGSIDLCSCLLLIPAPEFLEMYSLELISKYLPVFISSSFQLCSSDSIHWTG